MIDIETITKQEFDRYRSLLTEKEALQNRIWVPNAIGVFASGLFFTWFMASKGSIFFPSFFTICCAYYGVAYSRNRKEYQRISQEIKKIDLQYPTTPTYAVYSEA